MLVIGLRPVVDACLAFCIFVASFLLLIMRAVYPNHSCIAIGLTNGSFVKNVAREFSESNFAQH